MIIYYIEGWVNAFCYVALCYIVTWDIAESIMELLWMQNKSICHVITLSLQLSYCLKPSELLAVWCVDWT